MRMQRLTNTTFAVSAGLVMGGLALAAHAQFDPQGLYSARAIFNADVHFESAPDSPPSSVFDMLMGDDKRVHALVIDTHDEVGQNGDRLVLTNAHFRLVNHEEDDETVHDIIVHIDGDALDEMPRYDAQWWDMARERTREVWHTAGEGAESAWHQTQRGAHRVGDSADDAWQRTQEGAERAGRTISETFDRWSTN